MSEQTTDFLVIGAGLAGIAFAESMVQETDATVRLLDAAHGVGGRAATHRWEATGAPLYTDHGAPYFTARGERFQNVVGEGLAEGWLRIWSSGFPVWKEGRIVPRPEGHPRYAPPEGMGALARRLVRGLDARTECMVTEIVRNYDTQEWQARCANGRTFTGYGLILAIPAPQALSLAADLLSEEALDGLSGVAFDPAWTLMLRLERDVPSADWPGLDFEGHPVLSWASRDHTKRLDPYTPPVLVAHGSGDWSREHLEEAPAAVETALRSAVQETLGPLSVAGARVHRWRYARPTQLFPGPHFWEPGRLIGGCGDWCDTAAPAHGGKIEAALVSGWSLAAAVIAQMRGR